MAKNKQLNEYYCAIDSLSLDSRGFEPMFAVVSMAGFQEMVKEGDTLSIPLQDAKEGDKVVFKDVLMISKDGEVTLGKPMVSGASVEVKVLAHGRDPKIRVVKFRRRKRYHRVHGHKQEHTKVEVDRVKKELERFWARKKGENPMGGMFA